MEATALHPFVKSDNIIVSPLAGNLVSIDDAGDAVFASRALGEGAGIVPQGSGKVEVRAPLSGVLQIVAQTGHAFGIRNDAGVEVLVHVGIDTVSMNGEGFDVAVKQGDRVLAGDLLATVDLDAVVRAGHSTTTLITVTNTASLSDVSVTSEKEVASGEPIITVTR